MPELDFFRCLETALEPVFSATNYAQIPQDILAILNTNNLLKDTYLAEIECDKCGDDCPENNCFSIKHSEETNKYFYTCPTGYLKNPVWLTADAVKGKRFDFNCFSELIKEKSNLSSPKLVHIFSYDINEVADGEINGKIISVVYCRGLGDGGFANAFNVLKTGDIVDTLIVITPTFEPLRTDDAQSLKNNNIHLITLKTVFENGFDLRGIIKQKLPETRLSTDASVQLSIPSGTTWDKIEVIIEQDEERCDISINDDQHSYKYNNKRLQNVFVNQRDKKPNALWNLLVDFAKVNGRIGWGRKGYVKQIYLSNDNTNTLDIGDYSGETAKVQIKRPKDQNTINKFKTNKKLLCDALQRIFPGIKGSPISYRKEDKAYHTNLEISYRMDIPLR
ncbi:MAG: hypothetical protein V1709_07150 [Planctomycetota bacterium]